MGSEDVGLTQSPQDSHTSTFHLNEVRPAKLHVLNLGFGEPRALMAYLGAHRVLDERGLILRRCASGCKPVLHNRCVDTSG